jgi:DNA polymerase I-like protein with 3'-5' exonuclease and polymerase domains
MQRDFGAMSQPGGLGTKIYWSEPKEYVESFLGFKRFFTMENKIRKVLFELAQNTPKKWRELPIKVKRNDRIQTASGAVSSALYGACFGLSSAIVRQAKNHKIQSPGAEITKETQLAVWDHQPRGISIWIVKPMNVHDEINAVVRLGHEQAVKDTVDSKVASYRTRIPLIELKWKINIPNWFQK